MSDTTILPPKEAVRKAFEHFYELLGRDGKNHVLLEGLELSRDNQEWLVQIGFDAGRRKVTSSSGLATFGPTGEEPIREFRTVHVRAWNGEFVRLS